MDQRYDLMEENVLKVPRVSGIYWVYADRLFQRLKGETDIIYIGKADGLRKRLMSLLTGKGRDAFSRFERLRKNGFKLSFSYQPSENPKESEHNALKEFEEKHLELPPLNHSGYSYYSHKVKNVINVNNLNLQS